MNFESPNTLVFIIYKEFVQKIFQSTKIGKIMSRIFFYSPLTIVLKHPYLYLYYNIHFLMRQYTYITLKVKNHRSSTVNCVGVVETVNSTIVNGFAMNRCWSSGFFLHLKKKHKLFFNWSVESW